MSGKAGAPQKKTGKKGFETEELLRSYFLGAGFFVVRGVKLRHGGDELTDIDLWVYERSATLARRRIIIDIKDNGHPKAAERLFFVKGLADLIQVEAAGVATSDSRRPLRELARKHNVLWIDNGDLQRLKSSHRLTISCRLSNEQLDEKIEAIDEARSSKKLRDAFVTIKSSVADRFGPSCANTAVEGAQFFAKAALQVHPNADSAEVLTRLTYFSAAISAAALDFASGESALRPLQERLNALTDAIRFGDDPKGTAEKLRWTEAAIREFAPNGIGLAEVVKQGFADALRRVPAEGLAEVAAKMANSDRLFNAARDLEEAAYQIECPHFDSLSLDAKTYLGAVLDFVGVERVVFSAIWRPKIATADGGDNVASTVDELMSDENGVAKSSDIGTEDGKLL
ncbi:hypothetical protein [Sphingomonas sp. TDK1]|uniref:hypothetical protein n=1 Tax=Sphingomonas sp. TDK1 TaxID=453247 RepID=UPI000A0286B7|nr:hypothetical protein [Sphingomonas sp. TDK1]